MRRPIRSSPPVVRLLLLAAPLGLVLAAGPAAAQSAGTPLRPGTPQGGGPDRRPPPPALPGLAGRQAPAPIPGDPNQVLSPNAALFDAISRGDLPAARDAVSRGADLNARNVLGLTPLDAAVDQRRDEIAFFLLSARGSSARRPAGPTPAEGAEASALDAPPSRRGGGRGTAAERADGRPAAPPVVGPRPATSPRLFANDGGTPMPGIGFLGFDAGRPAGAEAPSPRRGGRGGGGGRG
jgi:hypothetical protein